MISEHTPAPWKLCQLPPAGWTYIQDENYKVIASVGEWNENGELNRFQCGSLEYQIIEEGKEPPKCEACCRQMTISSASVWSLKSLKR